jgi:putative oxidoreductase
MKIVALIARILLGLIFFIFGLNGFLQFIHAPLPTGLAGEFVGALIHSHYVFFISGVQLIAGILLLVDRFVPLALVLLGAVIANILVYHLTMQLMGIPVAIFVAILWAILAWRFRAYLAPLFVQKAMPQQQPEFRR